MNAWAQGGEIGPYTLESVIGSGGMGEVWRATDSRLGRSVAIKRVLAPSLSFQHEARAIAALNHPNICTLHDVGPDYLVMEYVDGQPIQGPVPSNDAVALALQVASALEAAHRKGIIHRDLKPANVLVADGRVKLLDFGVAHLHRDADADLDATITAERVVTGTPAYMAPEQIQGGPPDARSDIFSFGALLYELLSGRRAFPGVSMGDVFAAILRDRPAPLDAPDWLVRIVGHCLEKSPGDRYESVTALKAALSSPVAIVAPVREMPSIVVLPFANMSSDPEQEFFSDGLTEEIINALAHVQGLKVIARTSAFAFKGQHVDVRRIAESLGVTNVLEGSVRRGGNRIRVTAQLIKVDDGFHLWSERFDRDLADVFAVQDEIAAAITSALQGHLLESSSRVHTPSVEAYEAYLMARHYQSHLTQASLEQGRICYERAIHLDPRYALPHTGLAELYHIVSTGMGPDQQYRAKVRASAERGLALDPDLPEGHAWLGTLAAGYDRDWPEAERQYSMAVAGDPRLRHWYAHFYLRFVGRAAEAVAEHEAALRSDPLSHITRVGYVLSLMSAGRRDDAARESRRLIEFNPDFAGTYALLAFDLPNASLADALGFAERAHALTSWKTTGPAGVLAGLLARAGDHARSEALVRELGDPQEYGRPVGHALYHLARGDADRAIDFVGLALGQRHPLAMIVLVGGPYGAELRASSRWPTLAAQFNLP